MLVVHCETICVEEPVAAVVAPGTKKKQSSLDILLQCGQQQEAVPCSRCFSVTLIRVITVILIIIILSI